MVQQFHFWVFYLRMRTLAGKDIQTAMFIAALFTMAKAMEATKGSCMDEWIKMWYVYTMKCY